MTPSDPRLKDRKHFKHKWESFKSIYGMDIFDSIKEHGQIDPNIALWECNQWRIEPGQARWLAMKYLGIPTQKVLLCVRPEDDADEFMKYDYVPYLPEDLPNLFTDKAEHRGFDYIYRRFLRTRN